MNDVQLARQQWQEGERRVESARRDPELYAQLRAQVEVVTSALRRRIGQTYTLAELARAYAASDRWARQLLEDERDDDARPPDAATAVDAAFHTYARGATDYTP